MRAWRNERGFTLVEISIILLVLVILSMIMLPQLGNFNRLARFVKVKEDLGAICASMKKMCDEVGGCFFGEPAWRMYAIGLLIGPGKAPMDDAPEVRDWGRDWYDDFHVETDVSGTPVEFLVDRFDNHLQQNNPLEWSSDDPDNRYMNPIEHPQRWASGAFFGWRGPYFDEFTADPWGNRYASNVFGLTRPGDLEPGDGFTSAVVCYSTGPDGHSQTAFNQPMNDNDGDDFYGWKTKGDDLAVVLSAGGPF